MNMNLIYKYFSLLVYVIIGAMLASITAYSDDTCYQDILFSIKELHSRFICKERGHGIQTHGIISSEILRPDEKVTKVNEDIDVVTSLNVIHIKTKEFDILLQGNQCLMIIHQRKTIMYTNLSTITNNGNVTLLNMINGYPDGELALMKHGSCYDTTMFNTKTTVMNFYPYSLDKYKWSLITKVTYCLNATKDSVIGCVFTFNQSHNVKYSAIKFETSKRVKVSEEYDDIQKFIFSSKGVLKGRFKDYTYIDDSKSKGTR